MPSPETHPATGTGDALALGFFEEQSGCLARTFPRMFATGTSAALTTGTIYQTVIIIAAGTPVTNLSMFVAGTAKAGGTHGWYVLTDLSNIVLAVTADQTDAGTTWGSTGSVQTLPVTAPFAAKYTGFYNLGVMVTATTMPLFAKGAALVAGIVNMASAPVLAGTSLTGQTTPPLVGANLGAITQSASFNFYGWVS